jgi:nucleotide-binding universal stress UspA family protein
MAVGVAGGKAMELRDLLVVLDGLVRDDVVLGIALDLAQRHEAHVTGICPLELLYPTNLSLALGGYPEALALQESANRIEAEALEKASHIEAKFREQLRRNDAQGDWEVATGSAADDIARRSRTADLLVLGQADPDHPRPPRGRHLIEDAMMKSGRPLLIVPFAGQFNAIGTNVLIGWNGTREAARAAHDALVLIEPTAKITVLTVRRGKSADTDEVPGADMAAHLARHGLNVSAARTAADASISDGDALLAYASDTGADLLVVGGYGHSRARELILGGVSRELLDHMTLPVLMSH